MTETENWKVKPFIKPNLKTEKSFVPQESKSVFKAYYDCPLHERNFLLKGSIILTNVSKWSSRRISFINGLSIIIFSDIFIQKKPPELLYEKGVVKNFAKLTGKHLCLGVSFLFKRETSFTGVFRWILRNL